MCLDAVSCNKVSFIKFEYSVFRVVFTIKIVFKRRLNLSDVRMMPFAFMTVSESISGSTSVVRCVIELFNTCGSGPVR